MKNKLSGVLAVFLLTSSLSLSGMDLANIGASITDGSAFSSLSSFDSMSGISAFGQPVVKCTNPLNGLFQSFLGRLAGACGAIQKINLSNNISIGPCSINASAARCAKQAAYSFCTTGVNKIATLGSDGEKIVLSPVQVVGLSTKNSILTGGDIVMTGADVSCATRYETMTDKIRYGSISENAINSATGITKMPGFGAFDRKVETARDCMRAAGLAGKSPEEAADLCIKKKAYALPKDKTAAESDVADTAVKYLASPDKGVISNMAITESDMRSKMQRCDGSTSTASCEKNVYNPASGTGNSSKMEEIKASVELTKARELKIMEDAAMGPNLIVHYDDSSIDSLPIQTKAEYGSALKRQLAFKTAYRYLSNENSSITKEYLSVMETKMESAAIPFYEKNAINDISKAMQ